jgi:hypothetical protein
MNSTLARRAGAALASLALALAAAAPAIAQDARVLEPGSDTVAGVHESGDGPAVFAIRLFAGAPFSADVTGAKKSGLVPEVRLLGTDREEDGDAVFTVKGSKASLKNYVPKATGVHWIEVGAADGTGGGWTLKSKIKLPKKLAGEGAIPSGTNPVTYLFESPGRATVNVTVKGSPKDAGPPTFSSLRDPTGAVADAGVLKPGKTGFSLKGANLPKVGEHRLLVLPGTGGVDGTFTVKLTFKVTAPPKRELSAAAFLASPVVTSLTPDEGNVTQILPMTLHADFVRPGAVVEFKKGTAITTVGAGQITLGDGTASFTLNLGTWSPGTYDVTVRNADGGTGTLPGAFLLETVAPLPVSVSPSSAFEGETVRVRVSGSQFLASTSFVLRRGSATIPGAWAGSGAGWIDADFDLDGAAIGLHDLVATNPGAPEAVLPNAFLVEEIESLKSMTPPDNRDGVVVAAVIIGTGFLDGCTATLSREGGEFEIEGTDLEVFSSGEIRCTFDTTDAVPALWDLVVVTSHGATFTLPGAFRTRAPKGEPGDPFQNFSAEVAADGPAGIAFDPTRDEFLVVWKDYNPYGIVPHWTIYAQKLDAGGAAVGSAVSVSDDGGLAAKAFPTVGYDPVNDEYLVVWTEQMSITITQTGLTHPNGKGTVSLFQVLAQRLAAADVSKTGSNVHVSDLTGWNGGQKGVTWYLSDFHAYRPSLAFDAGAGQWMIAWMLEFDTTGLYSSDDFDVVQRSFEPTKPVLGGLTRVGATTAYEGDPALAYDANGGTVITAYNVRGTGKYTDLDLHLYAGGTSNLVVAGNGDDLGETALAVDPTTKTLVLSWTRAVSDGTHSAEAATVDLGDLSQIVGSPLTLGSGAADMLVRPVVNEETGDVHLFWTRQDGKGTSAAMHRYATSDTSSGLVASADEEELSSGSGDEGLPTGIYAPTLGQVAALWLATLGSAGGPSYLGECLPAGIPNGVDFWFMTY